MADQYYWLEPGGTFNFLGTSTGFTALNGFTNGIEILDGVKGLHMPPIRRVHQAVADVPGTRLMALEHDMRSFDLPIAIRGGSEEELRALMRAWRQRFDPRRGDSQLIVTTLDGLLLALTCRYAQGLEVDESSQSGRSAGFQPAVLTFEADDPYWYDVGEQTQSWVVGGTIPTWFQSGNILPIVLGASSLSGETTLDVGGEVQTWPIWTIAGPASGIVVANLTTGQTFGWGSTLVDTDVLTVDTRPGIKQVLLNGGPAQDALTSYDLWPLVTGANDVQVSVSGATAGSQVSVSWHNAYLGP